MRVSAYAKVYLGKRVGRNALLTLRSDLTAIPKLVARRYIPSEYTIVVVRLKITAPTQPRYALS